MYILRFVIEVDPTATRLPSDLDKRLGDEMDKEQMKCFKAVIEAAQLEAVR